MQILSCDGHMILAGNPDDFARNFDWIVVGGFVPLFVHKNVDNPKIIHVKTDYLEYFINNVLQNLTEQFILITGCSDFSPAINFKKEYEIIINHPLLHCWYATNNLSNHEKMRTYPGGHILKENSDKLLSIRCGITHSTKNDSNKILCCWRNRDFNVCGNEYITRHTLEMLAKSRPDIFDWVDPDLPIDSFYNLLSTYKFVLCPLGNGVDPCPKSFEAIALKTIPIFLRTDNTKDVYNDLPCIMVDNFDEILEDGFLENKYETIMNSYTDEHVLRKISNEYWVQLIKSSFD